MGSETGVREAKTLIEGLFSAIESCVAEAKEVADELQLKSGHDRQTMIIRSKLASVGVFWQNRYVNTLNQSVLRVKRIQGPEIVHEQAFEPDVTRAHGWCWRGADGEHITSAALAERCVETLLNLTETVT